MGLLKRIKIVFVDAISEWKHVNVSKKNVIMKCILGEAGEAHE